MFADNISPHLINYAIVVGFACLLNCSCPAGNQIPAAEVACSLNCSCFNAYTSQFSTLYLLYSVFYCQINAYDSSAFYREFRRGKFTNYTIIRERFGVGHQDFQD